MDLNVLPFFNIQDKDELLSTIWNTKNVNINIEANTSCLNLLNNDDLSLPSNWNPNSCNFITTEELFNSRIYCDNFTITQLNARSLKKL